MRFRCKYCGHIFDEFEGKEVKEEMDYEGHWYTYATYIVCPECGEEDLEEYYGDEEEEEEE